jgi:hypothetical protein
VIRRFWAAAAVIAAVMLGPAASARAGDDTGPLRLLLQGDVGLWEPSPVAPEDPPTTPYARLRRIRVGEELSGHDVHARVLFEAQPVTATGQYYPALDGGQLPFGGPVRATEAFVGWAPSRAFEIDAGSLRVPFSLSRQVDEADLRLPERPAFIQAFTPDFRTGAVVCGDLGEILYQAAFLSADQTIDGHLFDKGYVAAGRIIAEPIGPVGLRPWRRGEGDPWFDWFRFAAGLSVLYGTLAAPQTLAVDPEFTAQWGHFVVTAEYLLSMRLSSGASFHDTGAQGLVVEPGLSWAGLGRDVAARIAWQQAAGDTTWSVGAAATAYAPDPRARVTAGLERRWSTLSPTDSYWLILRLTLVVD